MRAHFPRDACDAPERWAFSAGGRRASWLGCGSSPAHEPTLPNVHAQGECGECCARVDVQPRSHHHTRSPCNGAAVQTSIVLIIVTGSHQLGHSVTSTAFTLVQVAPESRCTFELDFLVLGAIEIIKVSHPGIRRTPTFWCSILRQKGACYTSGCGIVPLTHCLFAMLCLLSSFVRSH